MKNYVKEGQKLPLFGIGPYLISGIGIVALAGIILASTVFSFARLEGIWVWVFRILAVPMILSGAAVWYIGALRSDMDKSITENKLRTSGIYSWVRNPMYSGWWILITGISFIWHNYMVLPFIFINWIILTVVLKNTEEIWLADLYGDEYLEYKERVNRCIPWIPKRGS